MLTTSWDVPSANYTVTQPIVINRILFTLQSDHFAPQALQSTTDSYQNADYNSNLECGWPLG